MATAPRKPARKLHPVPSTPPESESLPAPARKPRAPRASVARKPPASAQRRYPLGIMILAGWAAFATHWAPFLDASAGTACVAVAVVIWATACAAVAGRVRVEWRHISAGRR